MFDKTCFFNIIYLGNIVNWGTHFVKGQQTYCQGDKTGSVWPCTVQVHQTLTYNPHSILSDTVASLAYIPVHITNNWFFFKTGIVYSALKPWFNNEVFFEMWEKVREVVGYKMRICGAQLPEPHCGQSSVPDWCSTAGSDRTDTSSFKSSSWSTRVHFHRPYISFCNSWRLNIFTDVMNMNRLTKVTV